MISESATIMRISALLLFITAVAAEIDSQSSKPLGPIKCFQCNSVKHPDCASLTSADTDSVHYQECKEEKRAAGKSPFCRKTVYTILNNNKMVRINRECGFEYYKTNTTRCYKVDTDFKYESSCQCFTDGCNSAPQMSCRSFALIFLISASGLLIRLMN